MLKIVSVKKILRYILLILTLTGLSIITILSLLLFFVGIPLTQFIPASTLSFDTFRVEATSILLTFDSGFKVTATDTKIIKAETSEETLLGRVSATLDIKSFLHGKIAPRYIIINHPTINIIRDNTGLFISGRPFSDTQRRNSTTTAPPSEAISFFDALKMLQQSSSKLPSELQSLQGVQIDTAQVLFKDQILGDTWRAEIKEASLENRLNSSKLIISTELTLKREDTTIPLTLLITLKEGEDYAKIKASLAFKNLDAFDNYIPEEFFNVFKASGRVSASARLTLEDNLEDILIESDLHHAKITSPQIFDAPLLFDDIDLDLHISPQDHLFSGVLTIKDQNGIIASNNFVIKKRENDIPYLELETSFSDFNIDQIPIYIPRKENPNLYEWLANRLNKAAIHNATIKVRTPLSTTLSFAEDSPETLLKADFDYDGLSVLYAPNAPTAEGLSGHFSMDRGNISITSSKGNILTQEINDLTVSIGDVLADGTETLKIEAIMQGLINEVTTVITEIAEADPLDFSGQHHSKIALSFLLNEDIRLQDVDFDINTKLSAATFTLKDTNRKKYIFTAPTADLKILHNDFSVSGTGYLQKNKLKFKVSEKMASFGDRLKISATGKLNLADYLTPLSNDYVTLKFNNSPSPLDLQLSRRSKTAWDISGTITFKDTALEIPLLKYKKPHASDLTLTTAATYQGANKLLSFQNFDLKAPSLNLLGNGTIDIRDPSKSTLQISRLHVAETDLSKLKYSANTLDIKGRKLALTPKKSEPQQVNLKKHTQSRDPFPTTLNLTADLGTFLLGERNFTNLKLNAIRTAKIWKDLQITSYLSKKGDLNIRLLSNSTPQKITIKADDAGALVRLFSDTSDVRNGSLIANIETKDKNMIDLQDIVGNIKVKNVNIVNQPILLQILSYFTAEKWLSQSSGVPFSEINIKFALKGLFLTLQEAKFDGPFLSINLRRVTINLKTGEIRGRGRVVPLRTIGKVSEHIPVLGKIISKTQQRVVAVPFSLKGTTKQPKVSFIF